MPGSPTSPREAGDEIKLDRVTADAEGDRERRGRRFGRNPKGRGLEHRITESTRLDAVESKFR